MGSVCTGSGDGGAIGDGCIMLFVIIMDMGGIASALEPNGAGGMSGITGGP